MSFSVDTGNVEETVDPPCYPPPPPQVPGSIVSPLTNLEPKRKVWFTRKAVISVWETGDCFSSQAY